MLENKTIKELREIAIDLEPIVGRNVRKSGAKDVIIEDINLALKEGGDEAQAVLSDHIETHVIATVEVDDEGNEIDHVLDDEGNPRETDIDGNPLDDDAEKSVEVVQEREPESVQELKPEKVERDIYEHIGKACDEDLACYQVEASPSGRLVAYGLRRGDIIVNPTPSTLKIVRRMPFSTMTVAVAREIIASGGGRLNKALSCYEGGGKDGN